MENLFLWFKFLTFLDYFLYFVDLFEEFLWSYLATPLLLVTGLFLTLKFGFPQIRKFPEALSFFQKSLFTKSKSEERGVSPLQAFFTSIGGCIGIANLVGVCFAIQVGGPGTIFWVWVAAFLGMTIKYYEVFLGMKFRVPNQEGGFSGGPMYYLQKVFKSPFVPLLFCVLLAIYGTEIFMFNVVKTSLVENWHLNEYFVIVLLLAMILYATIGGMERVGTLSSLIIPLFLCLYIGMALWVFALNVHLLIPSFSLILKSAFNPEAALVGGFSGTLLTTMSQGITRGCYSGDIGVGYAAIVHAESSAKDPKQQALLSIFGIFLDSFVVCTTTALLVIITGVWSEPISFSQMVQVALGNYFGTQFMSFFMPIFIFLLGYSTIIAFHTAGLKSSQFISPSKGKRVYLLLSSLAFITFSFLDENSALSLMAIVNGLLLLINTFGIIKLRKEVQF